ncbi:efflux RND transporter periplasmic adaptor subunit [Corallococcus sp. AS-1-12]|uniref:efflux RND transporter periplasmic adaptor subunit n=1 Tax=Corallococcus sp. AS-1-12 TaxID=2874598 RepID=UPI001CC12E8E|nr:efflux RND transporter periplasmic adaptor subunit [Corallococcus sp. AS-1-12]MBZ4329959.1 efflux RND transporter periplasmic adaptor subunit [Corallococcus sp. AS-1-12]
MVLRVLTGLVILTLLALLGWAVSPRPSHPDARISSLPVDTLRKDTQRQTLAEPFLGVLISTEAVELAPRVEGRLESIKVHVGDPVRASEVVAVLDTAVEQRELAIAKAELLSARASAEVATLAVEQAAERLRRRQDPQQLSLGALSEEELATTQYERRMALAKLDAARAEVQESEARVAQYQQRISEASLRAPFEGVVAGRYADPGALVRSGQAVIHLLRGGKRQVRYAVPEAQAGEVRVGQRVRVQSQGLGARLTGRVAHVAPEVDAASRMLFVVADLDGTSELPSGAVVQVSAEVPVAGVGPVSPPTGQE